MKNKHIAILDSYNYTARTNKILSIKFTTKQRLFLICSNDYFFNSVQICLTVNYN